MRIQTLAFLICTFVQSFGQSFILRPNNTATNRLSLRSIELTNGGDYVCVGGYRPVIGSPDSAFIAIVSPGTTTVIGEGLFETNTLMWSVAETSNNEFVASGQVVGNHSFVCRFNSAGIMIWRTELFGSTEIRNVAESPDGNIWACGTIFGQEILACLDAGGNFLWSKKPPFSVSSVLTHLMPDGMSMLVFGTETNMFTGDQQASVRRFDLAGTELLHTAIGNNSGASETLYDVIRLPTGGYAIATQYVYPVAPFAGRQEIGVIRLDASLNYMPALTRAYIETGFSLVSPRIAADATSLYIFCTKNSNMNGGTIAMRVLASTGAVQVVQGVSRGSSRTGKILWNGSNLVMASIQDLSSNLASPPEVQADIAYLDPATLQRTTFSCTVVPTAPDVSLTTYYGTVSATSIPPEAWVNTSVTASAGPMSTPTNFAYEDCNTVLPIELLSFTARAVDDVVELRWVTATEHDNDYFEIERSIDGWSDWGVVANVEGVGNSQVQTVYAPVYDEEPLPGTSYYRLRQVDTNGDDSYSHVESVHFDSTALGTMEYYDLSGRVVPQRELATGIYIEHRVGSVRKGRKILIERSE